MKRRSRGRRPSRRRSPRRFDPCTCQRIFEAGCDGTWSPIHPYLKRPGQRVGAVSPSQRDGGLVMVMMMVMMMMMMMMMVVVVMMMMMLVVMMMTVHLKRVSILRRPTTPPPSSWQEPSRGTPRPCRRSWTSRPRKPLVSAGREAAVCAGVQMLVERLSRGMPWIGTGP
jgi:hypothetical protein